MIGFRAVRENAPVVAVIALPASAAAAIAWRTAGQLHLTVIAKATFAFVPDADMQRADPQPILRAEVHHGNNPSRSVRFTTDVAPYLGRADVLFTGHAYAPPERAAQPLPLRLAVFDGPRPLLDKRLVAHEKAGFQRMPVVYERAWSGALGEENPLGIEQGAGEAGITDPGAPLRPAGFGPIARAWPVRKRLLGATPRKALESAIAEIPDGFDWSYFQAAPPDQRTMFLRGDEWIVLEGLSPARPRVATRLPGARGFVKIFGLSQFGVPEGHLLDLVADTLRIDGDEQRCTLVCRRSFPVAGEAALAAARIVAGIEVAGEALVWPDPRWMELAAAPASLVTSPSVDGGDAVTVVIGKGAETVVLAGDEGASSATRPILPFSRASSHDAPAAQTGAAASTLVLPPDDGVVTASPLPFADPGTQGAPRAGPAAPIAGAPWSGRSAPRIVAPAFDAGTMMLAPEPEEVAPIVPPEPAPLAAPAPPATPTPPAVMAPIVLPGAEPPAAPAPPAATARATTPSPHDRIDLERCAAIAAELAERAASRTEILAGHGLTEEIWRAAEQRWNDAVDQEVKRGAKALRDRFDAAYVAAWEAIRGPFDVKIYATLVVADERGSLSAALDARRIRRTVWTRVKRRWEKRMVDPVLAAQVKEEIARVRSE
ncbi:DUF2169 family type VI secretion system accessory protein [Polyangium mundeleinium]|uniref:DUF2169 domain-containing protein n=1 Tax=Polyangium mundeleinium TaxID=2995306 RepID=A0ABT5EG85_9BACT|nr:DUF2169 domain-containing protein [Polyangium mundeleinium]MDC0740836.1 DUF2169 domain-containing protein [Polyangium mundeleinium]